MTAAGFVQFDMVSRALLRPEDGADLDVWTSELAFPGKDGHTKFIELAAFSYYAPEEKMPREIEALWSLSSRGQDYHKVVKNRLVAYSQYKKSTLSPHENQADQVTYTCFVDTQPLSERRLAKLAGLGWIGKNQNLIINGIGSFIYIGVIYWQVPEPLVENFLALSEIQEPKESQCGLCKRCVDACPGQALTEEGGYDVKACVSYLTQRKETPSKKQMESMGSHLYGCDVCQRVCPYNEDVPETTIEEFAWTKEEASEEADEFLRLSNGELKELHGHRSGSWRGWNVLRRNALINVYNKRRKQIDDEEWARILADVPKDSPLIRELIDQIENE